MFSWGGTRAFFNKSISKNFLSIIRPDNVAKIHFFAVAILKKWFSIYLHGIMLINKCLNVKGSSIRVAILDELCRIRMNMKSNIGYVPTRSGDLPSEALA